MESLIPIIRLAHFIGMALLLGGTFSSIILVRKLNDHLSSVKNAYWIMHLVAAPGLTVLIVTGILQIMAYSLEILKNAGYMHAKILLTLVILVCMILDIRITKKAIKQKPEHKVIKKILAKRQAYAYCTCFLTVVILYLVIFRPF